MITSTDFDSGGGAIKDVEDDHVEIEMIDRQGYDYLGYFHFKLESEPGETVSFEITNREGTADRMPRDYRLYYCPELYGTDWRRFDDGIAGGFEHTFDEDEVYVASWQAYPYGQTVRYVDRLTETYPNLVESEVIGESYEGRDLLAFTVSDPAVDPDEASDVVCTTRQHPGETHGSYHMEGIVGEVIDVIERPSREFEDDYVFHFLPNLNPDGTYHGYHYDDAQGNNLNREWDTPGTPEIDAARDHLQDAVSSLHWGFDLHSTTTSTYEAVPHWGTGLTDEQYEKIVRIDAASQSLSGRSGADSDHLARGWMHAELPGDGTAVTTEAWTYHGYSTADIHQEGKEWLRIVTDVPRPPRLLSSDGRLLEADGRLLVQS